MALIRDEIDVSKCALLFCGVTILASFSRRAVGTYVCLSSVDFEDMRYGEGGSACLTCSLQNINGLDAPDAGHILTIFGNSNRGIYVAEDCLESINKRSRE